MGILVDWDNEDKTVIRHTYKNGWELQDYIDISKQTYGMIESVDYTVHLLTQLDEGERPLFNLIAAARDHEVKRHPRRGLHIIMGANNIHRMMVRILSVVRPAAKAVKFARTEAEAYEIFADATVDKQDN